jgi:hypothetical protein
VKDSNGTFLNIGKFAPFLSFNDIQDLKKSIPKGMEKIVVSDFVRFPVASVADNL